MDDVNLVERLMETHTTRRLARLGVVVETTTSYNRDGREAAARIAALEAENARLRGGISALIGRMMNAVIGLQSGDTKQAAINSINAAITEARALLPDGDDDADPDDVRRAEENERIDHD